VVPAPAASGVLAQSAFFAAVGMILSAFIAAVAAHGRSSQRRDA